MAQGVWICDLAPAVRRLYVCLPCKAVGAIFTTTTTSVHSTRNAFAPLVLIHGMGDTQGRVSTHITSISHKTYPGLHPSPPFPPRATPSLGKTSAASQFGVWRICHPSASSPPSRRAQASDARAVALLGCLGDVAIEHDGDAHEDHAHL